MNAESNVPAQLAKSRNWLIVTASITIILLASAAALTIAVDPYFHYHAPLKGISYRLNNERYQNDGIVRHFEYDTVITGTSMAENFKTTECDAIFGCKSIKVPFSGARYKEIDENLRRAFDANANIRLR